MFPARPTEFEAEIAALERKFASQTGENLVFYGSSSIRLWPALKREFPAHAIENLGFGGSTLADCVHFFERLVAPRAPKQLVFYAGDNDLALGASVADVWEALAALLDARETHLGAIPFAFLGFKPSPARAQLLDSFREANEWCAREIAGRENCVWVEIFAPMLDSNNQPRPELFLSDQLHLSRAGYDLWNAALKRDVDWLD